MPSGTATSSRPGISRAIASTSSSATCPRDAVAGVLAAMERFGKEGVPNAFGTQRFGTRGRQRRARARVAHRARSARRTIRASGASTSPRCSRRSSTRCSTRASPTARGTSPSLGDLLKKEDTGGMFVCTDVQADRERADRGELCPTGPIVGARMRWPEGDVKALEERTRRPVPRGRRPRARAIARRGHATRAAAPGDRVLSRTSDE